MKLLHIADLHIGKTVNGFSMIEDQQHILNQVIKIAGEEEPDGILIAGDVYDKSQPSVEAAILLDGFLTELTAMGVPVFMISGNHDSPERLSFGSRIFRKNSLFIAGAFDGKLPKTILEDVHGFVNVYLLPFVKPATVRPYFDQQIGSHSEAVKAILSGAEVDAGQRNILLAHQFIISGTLQPEQSDSESLSVGGLDHVDASVFENFDYVALGHLHGAQRIGRDSIRYAGSPLKYSFSEVHHTKSISMIELHGKGEISVRLIPLLPLRDLREIKGPLEELLLAGRLDSKGSGDYIRAILTDEDELYDAIGQLRQVYPNLMVLDIENSRGEISVSGLASQADRSPMALFSEFYESQIGCEPSFEHLQMMENLFSRAGGDVSS